MRIGLVVGLTIYVAILSLRNTAAATSTDKVTSIAVLPLKNLCKDTEIEWLGYGFAESVSTKLSNVSSIQIVERSRLSDALKELKLQASGLVDPAKAGKLGKLVGAQYVILGSFQKIGESLKADARVVSVETSVSNKGVEVSGALKDVFNIESDLALKLMEALGKTPTENESVSIAKPETSSITAYEWKVKGVQAMQKDNDPAKAISCFDKAIDLKTDYADAYCDRGIAYYSKGDFDKAMADYAKAISFDPKHYITYYNRAAVYFAQNEYDMAMADYDKAIDLNPNFAPSYNGRGMIYLEKEDYDRAIAEYDKAIKLDPTYAFAYCNRGNAYDEKDDLKHALQDYNKSISLKPNVAGTYYDRGMAYLNNKMYTQAKSDLDKAISLDPNGPTGAEAKKLLEEIP